METVKHFIIAHSAWLSWLLLGIGLPLFLYALLRLRGTRTEGGRKHQRWPYVLVMIFALSCLAGAISVALSDPVIREALLEWMNSSGIYSSLIWTGIAAVLISILSRVVRAALMRSAADIRTKHKLRRTVQWAGFFVFGLVTMFIWASRLQALGMFLGMFAAGVALSLQETLLCLAGWVLIVWKKPFDIGDRIELNDMTGDVIDIQTFHIYLLEVGFWVDGEQSTGRMITVPNSAVFRGKLYNYTKGFPFIWNEIKTVVTFDSDWKKAKDLILEQAQEEVEKIAQEVSRQIRNMQRHFAIKYDNLTPIVYTRIEDIGVALTLRYLTPVRNRRGTQHKISEAILEEFARRKDINFAYPTQTIYTRSGKRSDQK